MTGPSPRRPLRIHCGALVLALATACTTPAQRMAEEMTHAPLLTIGQATDATLDCDRGHCANWHGLALSEEQRILVDVSSDTDPGVADFAISLYDSDLVVVADHSDPGLRPRKFSTRLGPGIYTLRVENLGPLHSPLHYRVRVTSNKRPRPMPRSLTRPRPAREAPEPEPRPASVFRPRTRPNRMLPGRSVAPSTDTPDSGETAPANAAMPPGMLVRADVIEVERRGRRPVAVIIEAGRPTGVAPGQRGRLVDAGRELARVKILDVYDGGSRAEIVGPLAGEITQQSQVEIFATNE